MKMAASAAFGKQRHKPAQSWLGTVWCEVKRTGFLLSSFFYAAFYMRSATETDTETRLWSEIKIEKYRLVELQVYLNQDKRKPHRSTTNVWVRTRSRAHSHSAWCRKWQTAVHKLCAGMLSGLQHGANTVGCCDISRCTTVSMKTSTTGRTMTYSRPTSLF